jgi:hypothetical protein
LLSGVELGLEDISNFRKISVKLAENMQLYFAKIRLDLAFLIDSYFRFGQYYREVW